MALDGDRVGRFLKSLFHPPRKKIIVLDDSPELRECLARELEQYGHEVFELESKSEGYDWVMTNRPDLIISDINSPGMNGLQFLRLLKANPHTYRIPFIFVTGMADLPTALEAKRLGAIDFIAKPFDLTEFRGVIARILNDGTSAPPDSTILKLHGSTGSGELRYLPFSTLNQMMERTLERAIERTVRLGKQGTWQIDFAIETKEKLLGCRFSRSIEFRDSRAGELLMFRSWLDDNGFESGIIFSFLEVTPRIRGLSELLGIHVVPDKATERVLGIGKGLNGNNSIVSAIGYEPACLDSCHDFIPFSRRILEEIHSSEGQKLFAGGLEGNPGTTEVLVKMYGYFGPGFSWDDDKKSAHIPSTAIWEICAALWLKGRITREDFGLDPAPRECLFALLSTFSSVRCERDAIVLW